MLSRTKKSRKLAAAGSGHTTPAVNARLSLILEQKTDKAGGHQRVIRLACRPSMSAGRRGLVGSVVQVVSLSPATHPLFRLLGFPSDNVGYSSCRSSPAELRYLSVSVFLEQNIRDAAYLNSCYPAASAPAEIFRTRANPLHFLSL